MSAIMVDIGKGQMEDFLRQADPTISDDTSPLDKVMLDQVNAPSLEFTQNHQNIHITEFFIYYYLRFKDTKNKIIRRIMECTQYC